MSNPFYKYLSEKVIKYFQINSPIPGDKFFVQFENDEQVRKLFDELKSNTIAEEFVYFDEERGQKYNSYQLSFSDSKLIVAASMTGGPHPDFLATLRNLVGVEKGYEQKSILFIHSSSLDSILGGSGSLCKEGMPLNINVIETDIQRKISETGYGEKDKAILTFYLKNKRKELQGTTASIFEYEDIICCLNDSQITLDEYRKFELFPDDNLSDQMGGKKLEERIATNHFNYVKVAEIHSYGLDADKLEKNYGEAGAKVLMKDDWESTSFSDIEKFIESKKNVSDIEYIPLMSSFEIWDREEGASKTKSRIRNIIVFVTSLDDVKLTLSFTDFTKKVGIDIPKYYQSVVKCEASGKKLLVELSGIEDEASFYHFKYNGDNAKFDFKIAVLRCPCMLLDNIKTQYSIELKAGIASAIRINTDDDTVTFNEYAPTSTNVYITEENQVVPIKNDEKVNVIVGENYPYQEDNDDVKFALSTESFAIPMIKAFAVEKPTVIEGLKLWYLKGTKHNNFEITGDNSLVFGTKKHFARDEFRKSLDLEKKYISLGSPFAVEKTENADTLETVDLLLPEIVKDSFNNIICYFKHNKTIPSLACLDDKLTKLYSDYLKTIVETVNNIPEGKYLSEEERNLFYLGMVKRQYGDFEILLSPLHPINIAYQLFINKENIDGLEDTDMDLLRKFQHTSLLPYINIDPYTKENKVYIPIEQVHSPEWKVYVEETLPRYKGSKEFVSKLVAEKIQEFIEHFSYLFSKETGASIRLNLINTGDCREIVQGIVKYYVRELNYDKSKTVIPIRVTMYSDVKMDTAFEIMSQIDDANTLVNSLGIEARVGDMSIDEIIDIYRRNVHFYYKNIDEELDYAHITFMELDDNNQAVNTLMSDIPSGVVMNGVSSGVPSEMLGDSYRTGFGTKYIDVSSELLDVAVKINAINAALNGEAYRKDASYALKMSAGKQKILDRVYDASNWVTFINPKVDLSYFKNDVEAKDLLIIHYSDQYNMTSSGYDAITVTKKSKQYQNAISRYLTSNGVVDSESHSKQIINMFNALNGDWLLRMLSYHSHFPVEKLSILSAMKVAVKRYSVPGVIWIPVSLEEILRVSGSVGLSQSGSIFSAKNLGFDGSTSDDLLLIGVRPGERVQVTFYPIEVKIGKVETDYLQKGINQAVKTRQIFDEILGKGPCKDKSIKVRLFRNFFMQQAIVNAGKMLLYDIGDGKQGWEIVTQSELRRNLLEEDYDIVDTLIPEMGLAGVFTFKEDCVKEREIRNKDVLILEKTKKEGVNLLAKSFADIPCVEWSLVKETEDLVDNTDFDSTNEEYDQKSYDTFDNQNDTDIDKNGVDREVDKKTSYDGRVLIGKDKYLHDVYWEFNNNGLANRHLLITGISGQGKTYGIQTMLYELEKSNVSAVIFDYTSGFTIQQLEEPFKRSLGDKINQQIIYSVGVPINPFKRHEIDLLGDKMLEKPADVAARLAEIFSHEYDFGAQQYSVIFNAAMNGINKYGEKMNMRLFQDELEELVEENKVAKSVISKMAPFFYTVDFNEDLSFDWGNILYAEESRVNIIQLDNFSKDMQVIITEMMLWDLWYYSKKYGTKDKPFVVVLDEAQKLSHTIKSPTAVILTEGRKFGWSAWFATQSLKVLKDDEIVRLLQAAVRLYFKPTNEEMPKIAKQLDATGETNWLPEIQRLTKGHCIVAGDRMKANGTVGPVSPTVTTITAFQDRI